MSSVIFALTLVEPLLIKNLLLWDCSPRQGLQLHNWWQFGTTIVWSRGVIASVSSDDGVCKSVPLTVETIEHLESWDQLQSCSKWPEEEGGSIFRRIGVDSRAPELKHWNVVSLTSSSSILALALVEPLSIQNLLLWDYSPRQGLQLHNWWQFGTILVSSRVMIASLSSGE
jgi:hypothetical protein